LRQQPTTIIATYAESIELVRGIASFSPKRADYDYFGKAACSRSSPPSFFFAEHRDDATTLSSREVNDPAEIRPCLPVTRERGILWEKAGEQGA
jgi:hypothetical protein